MADEKGRLGWVSAVPVLERGQRPRLAGARGVAPVSRRRSRSRSPGVSGPPDRRVRPVGGVCGAERRCLDDGGAAASRRGGSTAAVPDDQVIELRSRSRPAFACPATGPPRDPAAVTVLNWGAACDPPPSPLEDRGPWVGVRTSLFAGADGASARVSLHYVLDPWVLAAVVRASVEASRPVVGCTLRRRWSERTSIVKICTEERNAAEERHERNTRHGGTGCFSGRSWPPGFRWTTRKPVREYSLPIRSGSASRFPHFRGVPPHCPGPFAMRASNSAAESPR